MLSGSLPSKDGIRKQDTQDGGKGRILEAETGIGGGVDSSMDRGHASNVDVGAGVESLLLDDVAKWGSVEEGLGRHTKQRRS